MLMKAGGVALLAPDSCSWCVCRSGSDVRGQLRQRARAVGPAELAVVFGGLGCVLGGKAGLMGDEKPDVCSKTVCRSGTHRPLHDTVL